MAKKCLRYKTVTKKGARCVRWKPKKRRVKFTKGRMKGRTILKRVCAKYGGRKRVRVCAAYP